MALLGNENPGASLAQVILEENRRKAMAYGPRQIVDRAPAPDVNILNAPSLPGRTPAQATMAPAQMASAAPGGAPGGAPMMSGTATSQTPGGGPGALDILGGAGKLVGGLQNVTGLTNPFGEGAGGLMDTLGLGSPLNWTPTTGGWGGIGDAALGGGEFGWGAPYGDPGGLTGAAGLLGGSGAASAAPFAGWGAAGAEMGLMGNMGAAAAPTSMLGMLGPLAAVWGFPFAAKAVMEMAGMGPDKFDPRQGRTYLKGQLADPNVSTQDILQRAMFAGSGPMGDVLGMLQDGSLPVTRSLAATPGYTDLMQQAEGLFTPEVRGVVDNIQNAQNAPAEANIAPAASHVARLPQEAQAMYADTPYAQDTAAYNQYLAGQSRPDDAFGREQWLRRRNEGLQQ